MTAWRAFPNAGAPRVLIGPGDPVATGLRLYGPYSLAGRAAKTLLQALPDNLARRLLPAVTSPTGLAELQTLLDALQPELDEARTTVSVATGTPGPHRKATAQLCRHGQVVAYAKIAATPAAAVLLDQEQAALTRLAALTELPCGVPRSLAFRVAGGRTVLVQSAAPPAGRPAPLEPGPAAIELLRYLASQAPGTTDVATLLAAPGATWGATWGATSATHRQARDYLQAHFASRPVRTAFAHGDFAPWNLRALPAGDLFAFDWEYADAGHPLLTDLFHHLFMPACLVRGQDARAAVAGVWRRLATEPLRALLAALGVESRELPAYFMLYLLGLEQRAVQLGGSASFITDSLHHALVRAGHPGTRPRVLVAAYACEPDQGSEPGVGWQMAQAISARHEAWVVTRANNRAVIERALAAAPNPHLHFVYVDLPPWARFWKKGGRGVRTYYYLWQLRAAVEARRLLRRVSFDLAHHVTFVNDWLYTFLALLPLPFVWGPLGSNPLLPAPFVQGRRQWLRDRLRYGVQQFFRIADPLYWLCIARASLIAVINAEVAAAFPLRHVSRERLKVHTAIGVESLPPAAGAPPGEAGALHVVSIGKLIPIKGFHLAIPAFARLHAALPQSRLTIVGDGPERARLTALADSLQLRDSVTITGWLDRDAVLAAARTADVLLFPSGEGAGMVVLEAMGLGLPVVCLDFGGPGQMVGEDCGQRVPLTDREETIAALGDALVRYAREPELRRAHGERARHHVQENYLWEARSRRLAEWYALVLRPG